jgi:hypothetical protein
MTLLVPTFLPIGVFVRAAHLPRRIGPALLAGLLVSSAFVLLSPRSASAVPLAPPVVPASGVLFGASVTPASGQTGAQAFAAFESSTGRALALDRSYSRWDDAQPSAAVQDDAAHGRTPLLSIRPQLASGAIISWAAVASGSQDSQIVRQATALRDTGLPMIVIFHHEPEFSSGYGTAAEYVAAFRHYVAVFRSVGATNVAFSVVLGTSTYTNPTAWYPGDDVVDWIGADAYNFGACTSSLPPWRPFTQIAGAFYSWGSQRGKPLLLAEWGTADDPATPGRQADWLRDAAATMQGWPQLKAAAYFDRVGSCNWRLSGDSLAAFGQISRSGWANGAPVAAMTPGASVGAAPFTVPFELAASTGSGSPTGAGIESWTMDFGDGTPVVTGTRPPSVGAHTYSAGTWTAVLTVTDAAGLWARTSSTVLAAPTPLISAGNAGTITARGATVPAWISTSGISGSYYIRWGSTTAYATRSADKPLAAQPSSQAVTMVLSGLRSATRYHWQVVATSSAGTTYGPDRTFTTSG